jgi:hypothetical protein
VCAIRARRARREAGAHELALPWLLQVRALAAGDVRVLRPDAQPRLSRERGADRVASQEAGAAMIVTAEQAAIMAGEAIAAGEAFYALPMVGGKEYAAGSAPTARALMTALLGAQRDTDPNPTRGRPFNPGREG